MTKAIGAIELYAACPDDQVSMWVKHTRVVKDKEKFGKELTHLENKSTKAQVIFSGWPVQAIGKLLYLIGVEQGQVSRSSPSWVCPDF